MSSDPANPTPPPRRPFENAPQPVAFHKSVEFQRLLWFASLLVFVGLFALYAWNRAAHDASAVRSTEVVERAKTPPHAPTPAELEAREQKLHTAFEGALSDQHDGEPFHETPGYWRLLQILPSYSLEDVAKLATQRLDYAQAMQDPDAWRGEWVTVRGLVTFMYPYKLKQKVFGISDVYRGFMSDADGQDGLVFDLLDVPPPFQSRHDPIDVEGIFYRTVTYDTQYELVKDGKTIKSRTVPYLLARSMRVVQAPRAATTGFLQDHGGTLLVVMGLAIFSGRLLMYVFQRRERQRTPVRLNRPAGFHEMFEKKLREEDRKSDPRPPA